MRNASDVMEPADRQRRASDRAAVLAGHAVSRETTEGLDRFVALLDEWQARTNLVAPSTLPELWTRHIADSLQFHRLAPSAETWVDLGSGGGFPGIVVGTARASDPQFELHLVESNAKKAAFLRAAQRLNRIPGAVHPVRIEAAGTVISRADVVSARALASLNDLLRMVAPHLRPDARCLFAKGRGHEQEIADASAHWRFRVLKHESDVEEGSVILEIDDIAPVKQIG